MISFQIYFWSWAFPTLVVFFYILKYVPIYFSIKESAAKLFSEASEMFCGKLNFF